MLYDELQELLTRAVCDWAGVPLDEREIPRRVHELTAMFDRAGDRERLPALPRSRVVLAEVRLLG